MEPANEVAADGASHGTLNSIVMRPNRMEFDLSFAKMGNGVFTNSTNLAPQSIQLGEFVP